MTDTPPQLPTGLPALDDASRQHGAQVEAMLRARIEGAGGWLAFEDWMEAALYAPGLGYYSAGSTKLSAAGDFTTAPELTPLFGQALARQVGQVLDASGSASVLEFGAGTGALAAALLPALHALGHDPLYHIIELSPDLRERQAQALAPWQSRVRWLDAPPAGFSGCVLANEVLDAMPVALLRWNALETVEELGVGLASGGPAAGHGPFRWQARAASGDLAARLTARMPPLPGYRTELNRRAEAWVQGMGGWLERGAALLIDYGFPQRELYHPQRAQGTLMCHFRHHAHDQPLVLPGLQDITSHVDFTAMADAALAGGLDVLGYTSQARFLMNVGLLELAAAPDRDAAARASRLSQLNLLLSEAEMGELFKVLAVGRGLDEPLTGFARGDRRDRL